MALKLNGSIMNWFKKMNWLQVFIIGLILVFVFVDTPIPRDILTIFESPIGILILIALVFLSFITLGPLVGVFMILVAYELVRKSKLMQSTDNMTNKLNSVPSKSYDDNHSLSSMNKFPITLEEEVIHSMIPLVKGKLGPKTYKPVTSDIDGTSVL